MLEEPKKIKLDQNCYDWDKLTLFQLSLPVIIYTEGSLILCPGEYLARLPAHNWSPSLLLIKVQQLYINTALCLYQHKL